ncbi:hypothetical protein [Aeromicrobium sp. CnD17-E]|uniref:hypothetical protein n=1 Tax=Aeromicrobium sp. CnD17-E TaxID=2954487 RepID=UPI00209740DE|nr:hypothetical protein [Aeromicrobium sp. CnD17-E]MCO7239314.1 hypothetical protein [Aeromicrobium sp. CnD17-E]
MRRTVVQVVALVGVLLVLAGGAAALWVALASPPQWEVTQQGVVLTEEASGAQVGVELLFVALGAAVGALWGLVAGFVLRRLGWVVVPLTVAATLAASVLTWRLGVELGPEGPLASRDLPIGTRIPAQLAVDSPASFVVWAIAGLVGVFVVTWAAGRRPDVSERSAPALHP